MIRTSIKFALKAQKISQRKCAIANDLDYTSFNKFDNGIGPLQLYDIEKVFRFLKLKIVH
jgi:hypothetical protein